MLHAFWDNDMQGNGDPQPIALTLRAHSVLSSEFMGSVVLEIYNYRTSFAADDAGQI